MSGGFSDGYGGSFTRGRSRFGLCRGLGILSEASVQFGHIGESGLNGRFFYLVSAGRDIPP